MTLGQDRIAFAVAYFVGLLSGGLLVFLAVTLESLIDSFVREVWRPLRQAGVRIERSIPVAIITLLQLADYVSTRYGLTHGAGTFELNPVVRSLGLVGSKIAVVAIAVLVARYSRSIVPLWIGCAISSVFYLAVVVHNVRLGVIG